MNDLELKKHDDAIKLESLKLKIDTWKAVADVQKHFSDLEVKVRNFGILISSALINAVGTSSNSGARFIVFGNHYSAAVILAFGAFIVWLLFYSIGAYWYHLLPLGVVERGSGFEKEIAFDIPGINLTEIIGKSSLKDILF